MYSILVTAYVMRQHPEPGSIMSGVTGFGLVGSFGLGMYYRSSSIQPFFGNVDGGTGTGRKKTLKSYDADTSGSA